MFLELHAQSAFSFLEAAEQPETLAAAAARLEMPALALVDRDGVYGAPRFYRAMTKLGLRAIVGSELTLRDGSRLPPRAVADVLARIREHVDLDHAGHRLARNAERSLKPARAMERLFADRPDAVANAGELATRLNFTLKNLGYRFPDYPLPPGETPISYLRTLAEQGARERYGHGPLAERARKQIARELDLIGRLDLAGYFLIVWELVQYCRAHGILVQGRGSAANSAVCYSLGLTAVDPVGMDLLFERFLSEARGEWPDIDLDLPSGDRREQVIQHVYQRYGRHGAGMTANVITYRGRLAAREVGKVLGFDAAQVDRLAKVMNSFEFVDPGDSLPRQMS